jgi:tripartite-type tricarboxylate transporter receptor subunit TctC
MSILSHLARIALLFAAAASGIATACAQTPAEFFKGREMTLIVPAGPSGGYAIYSQFLSRHLSKHLPGNPTIVVKYMPGGGGNVGANYLYNVAPKDGSVIAAMFSTLTMTQALRPSGAKFDATKFSWIGSIAPMINSVGVFHTAPATTLDGLRKNEVVVGATGKSNDLYIYPQLMNGILNTKFKIVLGYADSGSILLAIEKGEAQALSMGLEIWYATRPEWIKDHKIVMVAQTGMKRDKLIPDVPTLYELAKSPEDKAIMQFAAVPSVLGRSYAAPPGIPGDRLAALRKAFDETVADPEFIKDVTSRKLSIDPTPGSEIAAFIQKNGATPPAVVTRARKLLGY